MNQFYLLSYRVSGKARSKAAPKNFAKVNKKLFKSQPVYCFFDPHRRYLSSVSTTPGPAVIDRKRGGMGVSKFISLRVTGWAKRNL